MNKKQHLYGSFIFALTTFLSYSLWYQYHYNTFKPLLGLTWLEIITIIVFTPLFALYPDIDTEIGRHRATFHNIFVYFTLLILIFLVIHPVLCYALTLGYFSHVILDLLTKHGVKLFYPLSNKSYGGYGINASSTFASILTIVISFLSGLFISSFFIVILKL